MLHLFILSVILICFALSEGYYSISRSASSKISGDIFSYAKYDDTTSIVGCSSPLNCWLDSLYFYLPETCFIYDGVKGCFSRLTCRRVAASQIASGVENFQSMIIQIFGGEAQCKGKWEYGYIGGEITAHIKRTDVSIIVKSFEADIYPVAVNFTSCQVPHITIDLKFRGGLVGILLQAISNIIERILENDVKTLICKDLAEYVAKNVSGYLAHDLNPYLKKFTRSQPINISNKVLSFTNTHDYVNWNTIPFNHANNVLSMLLGKKEYQDIIKLLVRRFSTLNNHGNGLFLDLHNLTHTYTITKKGLQASTTSTTNPLLIQILNNPTLYTYSQTKDNELGNLTLILHTIRINGLDTLISNKQLLVPHPHSNHTLQSSLSFQDINITLLLTVGIMPSQSTVHGETLLENTEVFINLSNITITTIIDLFVNKNHINNLYVDQLHHIDCLLSTISYVNITSLSMDSTINKIKVIVFDDNGNIESNNLESNIDDLISNLLKYSITNYQNLLKQVLHGIIASPLRKYMNILLTNKLLAIGNNPLLCVSHRGYSNLTNYIVWNSMSLFPSLLYHLLNPNTINRYILKQTHQSGQIDMNLPNEWIFKAAGLNSVLNFSLLHPITTYENNNNNNSKYDVASEIAMGKLPSLNFPKSHYYNNTAITVELAGVFRNYPIALFVLLSYASLQTDWIVKYDINKLFDFQLRDALRLSCLISAVDTIKIQQLQVILQGLRVVFDGGVIVLTEDSSVISQFLTYLSSDKFKNIINTEMLSIVESSRLNCALPTNTITNTTNDSSHPSDPILPPSASRPLTITIDDILVAGGFALCFVVLGIISIYFPRRKLEEVGVSDNTNTSIQSGISSTSSTEYHLLATSPQIHSTSATTALPVTKYSSLPPLDDVIADVNSSFANIHKKSSISSASALMFRYDIPVIVRYGLVLLVILNISLFLWSNVSDAAVVVLHSYIDNTEYHPNRPVFVFSLSGTVCDMWRAKVYPLAILIAFFSGAWPYVKLVMMLVAWMAPESLLTSARREQWLISLDFLGKWSLVDIFVLVLMLVAFHVQLYLSDSLKVIVNVVPILGFHLFLLATMISLLLGHTMLACHRSVSISQWITGTGTGFISNDKNRITRDHISSTRSSSTSGNNIRHLESLCSYQFSMPTRKGVIISISKTGHTCIVLLCLTMFGLLVGAGALTSFSFQFGGLVGWWLAKSVGASHTYSLLEVAYDLPYASGTPNDVTILIIQAVFLAFGIIIPFLSLVIITILWVLPVTLVAQRRLLVVAEILNAWSALDVFAVSVAAAILQVRQFASFIIGDSCDFINSMTQMLLKQYIGGEGGGLEDSKCFDVTAFLTQYSWCLFLAAFLFTIMGPLTLRYTRYVLRGRSLKYASAMSSILVDNMDLDVNETENTSTSTSCNSSPQRQQQQQHMSKSIFPIHSSHHHHGPHPSNSISSYSSGGNDEVDTMLVKLLGTETCHKNTPNTTGTTTSWFYQNSNKKSNNSSSSSCSDQIVDSLLWLGLLQQQ